MTKQLQEIRAYCLTLISSVFLAGVFLIGYSTLYTVKNPMQGATQFYTQNLDVTSSWPYLYKYYLFKPENYDENREYPLVVLLHGISRHMHGGRYILSDDIIGKHPAFVLVPIAPEGMFWAYPGVANTDTAAPLVMDAISNVTDKYSIDRKRIYLSGYSMGGVGTYGLIANYPDVFAAGLSLCGHWDPNTAASFPTDVPITAVHGSLDHPEGARAMINALTQAGKPAEYREYEGVAHNVWDYAYPDSKIWDRLFAQKRRD